MGVVRSGLVVVVLALLGACGDDGVGRDSAVPGDAAVAEDAALADADEPSDGALLRGTVRVEGDYADFFRGLAMVEGAEVCAIGPDEPDCAITNERGNWLLEAVPAFSQRELRYSASGYMTAYRFLRTTQRDLALYGFAFASDDLVGLFEIAAEVELDSRLGVVVFEATARTVTAIGHVDVAGATVRLRSVATGGEVRTVGAYVNDMQIPTRGLTETTSAGWGFFVNVQPGEYLATFTHATRTCMPHPEIAWPAPDGSNATVRIAVHSNAVVYATAYCPE